MKNQELSLNCLTKENARLQNPTSSTIIHRKYLYLNCLKGHRMQEALDLDNDVGSFCIFLYPISVLIVFARIRLFMIFLTKILIDKTILHQLYAISQKCKS